MPDFLTRFDDMYRIYRRYTVVARDCKFHMTSKSIGVSLFITPMAGGLFTTDDTRPLLLREALMSAHDGTCWKLAEDSINWRQTAFRIDLDLSYTLDADDTRKQFAPWGEFYERNTACVMTMPPLPGITGSRASDTRHVVYSADPRSEGLLHDDQ